MERHEELVRGWFAAGDDGDIDEFDRFLDPLIAVHAPLGLSTIGIEAEKETWRRAKEAMPDLCHHFVEALCVGDTVAARSVVTGTLRGEFAGLVADGVPFEMAQAVFAHVRGGRIVEAWEIADTGDLVQQVSSFAR